MKDREQKYSIRFTVNVREVSGYGGSLSIDEEIEVTGKGLFELSGVLHQVHQLAEKIRDEQAGIRKG